VLLSIMLDHQPSALVLQLQQSQDMQHHVVNVLQLLANSAELPAIRAQLRQHNADLQAVLQTLQDADLPGMLHSAAASALKILLTPGQ
jgi:hypothetical protein